MQAVILMTYRAGATDDRRANLFAVLEWLAQSSAHDVLVVEQDEVPTLTGMLPHPRCRTVFAYNPGAFNKSWGFNVGVRHAPASVYVFADADVLLPDGLDHAIAHCQHHYMMVKPYRRFIDLDAEQTAALRNGLFDPALLASRSGRDQQGEFLPLCSGIFAIQALALHHLGGWDERFRGWGGEDDAMTYALQRARMGSIEFDEQPALHLWHPRSESTTFEQPFYRSNCDVLARYYSASDPELSRLAEVTRQTMGNPEKYRPAP